jgi:hypothetical protein
VTVRSLWLFTLALVARVGLAQSAPTVDPTLPFTIEELEQALAARGAPSSIASLVVTAEGEGAARIAAADMTRVVAFGNRIGYPAARVVALAIYDLLLVEPMLPVLARLDERARPTDRPVVQLAALGGVARGVGAAEPPGVTLSVALTAALGDRLRGRISVSTWSIPEHPPSPISAGLKAWPIRIGAGIRRGDAHVIAGPTALPYTLSGTAHQSGVLVGLGASADASLWIGLGFRLVVACGFDVLANRVELRNNGALMFATPRVLLSGALGIAIEVGP